MHSKAIVSVILIVVFCKDNNRFFKYKNDKKISSLKYSVSKPVFSARI